MSPAVVRPTLMTGIPSERARLLCSTTLSGGAVHPGCVSWSGTGQALVLTENVVHIITPAIGIVPNIAGNLRASVPGHASPSAAPSNGTSATTSIRDERIGELFRYGLEVSMSSNSGDAAGGTSARPVIEKDLSTSFPGMIAYKWKDAIWSPPGLGPLGSCLLVTLTSEFEVSVFAAHKHALKGPWNKIQSLTTRASEQGDDVAATRFALLSSQTTSISWSSPAHTASGQRSQTALLACGNRVGELSLWRKRSRSERLDKVFCARVERAAITSIAWGPWSSREGFQSAKLAIATSEVVQIFTATVTGAEDEVTLSPLPSASDRGDDQKESLLDLEGCSVSHVRWVSEDCLCFATPGQMHILDTAQGKMEGRLIVLGKGEGAGLNPFLPVISLEQRQEASISAMLSNGSIYTVPLNPEFSPANAEETVQPHAIRLPVPSLDEKGRARPVANARPLLWGISRGDPEERQLPRGLYAEAQEADEAAPWRYRIDKLLLFSLTSTEDLPAPHDANAQVAEARRLANSALQACAQVDTTPIHQFREFLAFYSTTCTVKADVLSVLSELLGQEIESVEQQLLAAAANTVDGLGAGSAAFDQSSTRGPARYARSLAWLAQWAERQAQSNGEKARFSDACKRLQIIVLTHHIYVLARSAIATLSRRAQTRMDVDTDTDTGTDEDARYVLRIAGAAYLLLVSTGSTATIIEGLLSPLLDPLLQSIGRDPQKAKEDWESERRLVFSIDIGERCPACNGNVCMQQRQTDDEPPLLRYARCENGHVWNRCSVTLGILSSAETRKCAGCWRKAALSASDQTRTNGYTNASQNVNGDEDEDGPGLLEMALREATGCVSCSNFWIID